MIIRSTFLRQQIASPERQTATDSLIVWLSWVKKKKKKVLFSALFLLCAQPVLYDMTLSAEHERYSSLHSETQGHSGCFPQRLLSFLAFLCSVSCSKLWRKPTAGRQPCHRTEGVFPKTSLNAEWKATWERHSPPILTHIPLWNTAWVGYLRASQSHT